MKIQVRRNVFETNSSSVHTLVVCKESDYDCWKNGEVLLFMGWEDDYPFSNKPQKEKFYTKEEAIEFFKSKNGELPENDEELNEWLRENHWDTYDEYGVDYEYYSRLYETESGDRIVIFGYYGYDS